MGDNRPSRLECGHIFHSNCCDKLPSSTMTGCISGTTLIECSSCSKEVPKCEELPLCVPHRVVSDFLSPITMQSGESPEHEVQHIGSPRTAETSSAQHNISKFRLPPKRKTHGQSIRDLYHLTEAGEEIKRSGEMLRGRAGMVGGGIYFAESLEAFRAKALSTGYVVKARVLVGKTKQVNLGLANIKSLMHQYTFTALQTEGYDSLQVIGLRTGDEFIVYNKDQVELLSVERDDTIPTLDA